MFIEQLIFHILTIIKNEFTDFWCFFPIFDKKWFKFNEICKKLEEKRKN